MVHSNAVKLPDTASRPHVTSYDTGFEHSLEHWLEVQHLVGEASDESAGASKPAHSHGILSVA